MAKRTKYKPKVVHVVDELGESARVHRRLLDADAADAAADNPTRAQRRRMARAEKRIAGERNMFAGLA